MAVMCTIERERERRELPRPAELRRGPFRELRGTCRMVIHLLR